MRPVRSYRLASWISGQGHPEADDVGQHVPGVRQQRQRVGDEAGDDLDDEEHGDQTEGDGQRADVAGTGPCQRRTMRMTVRMAVRKCVWSLLMDVIRLACLAPAVSAK